MFSGKTTGIMPFREAILTSLSLQFLNCVGWHLMSLLPCATQTTETSVFWMTSWLFHLW